MHYLKFVLLLFLFPPGIAAQQQAKLDARTRSEIVQNISRLLLDNYVYPDTAVQMSDLILGNLGKGRYNAITDPVAFSDLLTLELYSVYHDGHLLVQYAPPQHEPVSVSNTLQNEDPLQRVRNANFGLRKAEVLNGNIGYIAIDNFWADSIQGKASVKAALQFVSNTHALIIDLRYCGGGSQETVNMICGYFLEKRTHLNDMYDRAARTTTEYWTEPDASFTLMHTMPLYILTSNKTFSAAEEFCYDLQNLGRAIIVGEITGGGAHGTFTQDAGHGFRLSVPYSTAVNPVTKTSWEKTGVKPEIEVPSGKALDTAQMKIFDQLIAAAQTEAELFELHWQRDIAKAINNPVVIGQQALQSFAGKYGERTFTLEDGKLYYQRTGRPKFELEAMGPNLMKATGNNYFRIEFVHDANGNVNAVHVDYRDRRKETSYRTE